jgi:hypothetical protein
MIDRDTRTSLSRCTFTVGETSPEVWNFYVSDGQPSEGNALPPMLTLWDDGTFHLRLGETDAYTANGRYQEKQGVLTLHAADGSYWVFEQGNRLLRWIFRADLSSAYAAARLSDGCTFGHKLHTTLGAPSGIEVKETYATADYLTKFAGPASLSLLENGEFYLDFMTYTSSDLHDYISPYGTYEERDGRLYLNAASDGSVWVFEKTGTHLRLLWTESSGESTRKFEDGCLFYSMSILTGASET